MQTLDEKIGVLVKTSFVDYPGRIAAAVFLGGCNLRCPYCYNKDLVTGTLPESEAVSCNQILEHLQKRRQVLSGFVISGGEPTLSPHTETLIKKARDLGYMIKLDTNGMLPEKLAYFLENPGLCPDFVAMDVKTSPSRYGILAANNSGKNLEQNVMESIALVAKMPRQQREYRTVLVPSLVEKSDIQTIASILPPDASWRLARFRPGECIDPDYNKMQPYTEEQYQELTALAASAIQDTELR